MCFYFCVWYICIKGDSKQVENDLYDTVMIFWGSYDLYGYEIWESNLESFFSYFALPSEQKCYYAQIKLVEKPYHCVKDNDKFCRCWSRLHSSHSVCPHIFYAFEAVCKGPNAEQKPKLENRSNHRYLNGASGGLRETCSGQAAKIDTDLEPLVLVESGVLKGPGPDVAELLLL